MQGLEYMGHQVRFWYLTPRSSIKGLVTEGETKLCCQGFVLALFQSTAAYIIDSEHTRDYRKLFQYVQSLNITSYSK